MTCDTTLDSDHSEKWISCSLYHFALLCITHRSKNSTLPNWWCYKSLLRLDTEMIRNHTLPHKYIQIVLCNCFGKNAMLRIDDLQDRCTSSFRTTNPFGIRTHANTYRVLIISNQFSFIVFFMYTWLCFKTLNISFTLSHQVF